MSRTDHHSPEWVRALHAHRTGTRTEVRHSRHCEEYTGPLGVRDFVVRRVTRAEADAYGWEPSSAWAHLGGRETGYYRVPHGPFGCDVDTPGSRCLRFVADRDRWYCYAPPSRSDLHTGYYGPERAAVRDALRDAAKEHRATGDVEHTEAAIPVRQTRRATWAGGWWD